MPPETASSHTPATTGNAEQAFGWRFTAPLYLGATLNPVNSSLIATALAPIAAATGVSVGRTAVLVAALYLASAVGQPTAGRLAEVLGPRRVFLSGCALVMIGGLVGSFASSIAVLTCARVLIGLGTATGYPTAMLMIRRRAADAGLVEPPGGVLGGLAIAGTATAAVGLPLGGVMVGFLGWRSVFLINVPVVLVTALAAMKWVPKDPRVPRGDTRRGLVARLDLPGIAGFGASLTALLIFLLALPSFQPLPLVVSLVLGCALTVWELRSPAPFLDIRLLTADPPLARTYVRFGLTMLGSYAVLYGVSQWLAALRGFSPEQTGLLLLPLTVVSAGVSGVLSRRNAVRGPLVLAALAALAGAVGVLLLDAHAAVGLIIAVTVLFGIMSGAAAVANQTALYQQAPAKELGTAAGMLRASGYLGSVGSSAITSIVFHEEVSDAGLHSLAIVLVVVGAVVLLMTLGDRSLRSSRPVR